MSHIDPVSNEYLKFPSVDDVAKQDVEVDVFNIERINEANHERLKNLSENKRGIIEPQLDELDEKLFKFLDNESTFGKKFNFQEKLQI